MPPICCLSKENGYAGVGLSFSIVGGTLLNLTSEIPTVQVVIKPQVQAITLLWGDKKGTAISRN